MDCIYNCSGPAGGIDWPAWVQAIGSVLAIMVAIAVPIWIRRVDMARAKDEQRLRVKSFALEVLPWLEALRNTLLYTTKKLKDPDAYLFYDEIAAGIEVPSQLQQVVRHLHELGEASNQVQDAVAKALEARWLMEAKFDYIRGGGVFFAPNGDEILIDEPKDFQIPLGEAIVKLNAAIYQLRTLFN